MNNRRKGITFEHTIMKEITKLGYTVRSSRELSKYYDDKGVDILDDPEGDSKFPHHIQCKSTSTRVKYEELFSKFTLKDKPLVIIHKFTKKAKTNFISLGEFVIMSKETYYNLINESKRNSELSEHESKPSSILDERQ